MKTPTAAPARVDLESLLTLINHHLDQANELAETVSLPPDLAAALATGRPELIALGRPRPLDETQAAAILHALGVLIKTNFILREHVRDLGKLATALLNTLTEVHLMAGKITSLANFRAVQGEEE